MKDTAFRPLKIVMIVFLVFITLAGCVASCNALNQSGFCKQRMSWVSDDEKIALAITALRSSELTTHQRLQIAKSFRPKDPGCCRVYKPSELIGTVAEIEE